MSADAIRVTGTVVDVHRGGLYDVEARMGDTPVRVLARLAGRLIVHRIRVIVGDEVEVEISPFDTRRGRITFRGRRVAA